jgi:hypothetical protein
MSIKYKGASKLFGAPFLKSHNKIDLFALCF